MGSLGLDIGLRALLTSQAALDTAGHNITNANTPGYSRQTLDVSSATGVRIRNLLLGAGVQADTVRRTMDELVHQRLVLQTSSLARLDARLDVLSQAEGLFGSADTGISARIRDFFAGLSTLSTAPEDPALRGSAVQSAGAVAREFNELAGGFTGLASDTLARLDARVGEFNALAERIHELNRQIVSTEGSGVSANDLRDQRDQAVRALAELVDARAISDPHGSVRVLVGGSLLVSSAGASELSLAKEPDGSVHLELAGSSRELEISGGAIGGLLQGYRSTLPQLSAELDALARQWIFETNRAHSTGVGLDGPFRRLDSAYAFQDQDGDGSVTDELLANSGLPFDARSGELTVNVTDLATGAVEKHVIAIDAAQTTVGDLLAELDGLAHLTASLDGQERMQVYAAPGYGFDFSARLDPDPDAVGSFGGGKASLGSGAAGPFALADGDTLDLVGPAGPFTLTFDAADFAQIGQASAAEIAAVINADPNAQANGIAAAEVGGRLFLQTAGSGAGESFTVASGSVLGAFGWSAATTVTGSDVAASVAIGGSYTGAANDQWTFVPSQDGVVGTTPGLQIHVFDSSGARIATLDVGAGYVPGDELAVTEGVTLRIGFGTLSASENDAFALDVQADSDTADLLPALGLNALFTGTDAASMELRADIAADPDLLAASATGASGDAQTLLALLALDEQPVPALGGATLSSSFADLMAGVGLEIGDAQSTRETEDFLLQSLQARRDEVSGVNIDEELVQIMAAEQAYSAASQFIRVQVQVTDELLSIL